jgi:ABC-2 type transport system ATP-binding protein
VPEVVLEVEALGKRYGSHAAVREVSFAAGAGEIVGLLGPNGAGKTTLIRLLTTLLAPSSGRFRVAGVPSNRPAEIRRRVGALPESGGYPATQTGAEYLRYHAGLYGLSRRAAGEVSGRLLAEVGLAERAGTPIRTYSRGMRQRLGIARALVNDPAVVFLDEPTLGLDPAGHRALLALLRGIAVGRRATVVLSTHDLPDVEEVCSAVVILDRGRVVSAGPVADVVAAVAAPGGARVRVPVGVAAAARELLAGVPGLTVAGAAEQPGVLAVSSAGAAVDAALRALAVAGVPVLQWEVARAGLGDAFVAATSGGPL